MKIIKTKWQKLIISLFIIITLFNVVFPTYAHAGFWGGGTLFEPIANLICGIGDVFLNTMQGMMMPGSPKAVDIRTMGSLIAEEKTSSDNWLDQITGNLMNFSNSIDNVWGLGSAWKVVSSGAIGKIRSFKKYGPLALIPGVSGVTTAIEAHKAAEEYDKLYRDEKTTIPMIVYSPAAIFSNRVPALDVNFINPSVSYIGGEIKYSIDEEKWKIIPTYEEDTDADADGMKGNLASKLQNVIATWYVALRNISIVAMLSVLIYVAIRIILSSTAGETAKYKTLLKDWIIGMCLLFTLHFMMAFILKGAELVTNLFREEATAVVVEEDEDGNKNYVKNTEGVVMDEFMGGARRAAVGVEEIEGDANAVEDKDLGEMFGYTVVYILLVFYTMMFTIRYLKRFLYLAFLTMISPLVAFTYPIDKMKDGSAQAFNMWTKEYIYNVLIQPLHLILYCILITSAGKLASENLIYTIIALGFLLEAEKIFKSLFGFNKASGGEFSSAVTGGLLFGAAANVVKKGFGMLPGDDKDKKGAKGDGKDDGKIRMDRKADSDKKSLGLSTAFGGSSGGDSSGEGSVGGSSLGGGSLGGGSSSGGSSGGSTLGGNSSSGSGLGASHRLVPPPIPTPTPPPPPTPRRTIKLGTGVAKGRYTSPFGKITNRIGNKYNNSKFGKSKPGKVIKGVAKVGGAAGRKVFTKKNGIRLAKGALAATGAVVGGTIGIAAGLASDNPGDILKYGALGAGAGAVAGNATVGATVRGAKATGNVSKSIREQYETGAYGKDEAQRRANERADKKWRESAETKRYYKDKYENDWEDAMASAEELRKRGIVDQKEIDQAIKMTQRNEGLNYDQAAAIMKSQRGLTAQQMRDNWDNIYHSVIKQVGDFGTADMIMDEMNENLKE